MTKSNGESRDDFGNQTNDCYVLTLFGYSDRRSAYPADMFYFPSTQMWTIPWTLVITLSTRLEIGDIQQQITLRRPFLALGSQLAAC